MNKLRNLIGLFCTGIFAIACMAQPSVDNNQTSEEPNVHIEIKGSDTMVNLALAWTEAYQEDHTTVSIAITGGGSGTGIAALLNNTVDIANASRQIKEEEYASARNLGIDPYEVVVARDAIAIIVNLNNPIDQLTLEQVSDIYQGKYQNWQELGGYDRPIVRTSRESNSGTHVYFLENVLRLGEPENQWLFDPYTLLLPSSEGIIAEVRDNPNAIGYDGLGYVTPEVKVLGIKNNQIDQYIWPSSKSVGDGTYPIARDMYVYTDGEPQDAIKQFIDWILSDQGQTIVTNLGFVTVIP